MKRMIRSASSAPTQEELKSRLRNSKVYKDIILDILDNMSESRKKTFRQALDRSEQIIGYRGFKKVDVIMYKQGFYITFESPATTFAVWAWDDDGDLIIDRKPNDKSLDFLHKIDNIPFEEHDFDEI